MLADGRMSRKLVEELVGQVGEDRRLLFARSFVHRVVLTYWRAVLGRGCRDPRVCQLGLQSLVNGADKRADDLGRMMASLPREAAAFEISSLYTSMLPPELRSQMGAFLRHQHLFNDSLIWSLRRALIGSVIGLLILPVVEVPSLHLLLNVWCQCFELMAFDRVRYWNL